MFGRMLPVKLFVPGGKENLPKSLHVVKIDEICNPDKYLLFKKKKRNQATYQLPLQHTEAV